MDENGDPSRATWRRIPGGPQAPAPSDSTAAAGKWLLLVGVIVQAVSVLGQLAAFVGLIALRRAGRHFGLPWGPRSWPDLLPFPVTVPILIALLLIAVMAGVLLLFAWRAATRSELSRAGVLGIAGGVLAVSGGILGVVGLIGGILCLLGRPIRPAPAPIPATGAQQAL